jgi:hypothetical protein
MGTVGMIFTLPPVTADMHHYNGYFYHKHGYQKHIKIPKHGNHGYVSPGPVRLSTKGKGSWQVVAPHAGQRRRTYLAE